MSMRRKASFQPARLNLPRLETYPLDQAAYRLRTVIECMFCCLKDLRRIATRYAELARNFLAAVALVAAAIWWAD